MRRRRGSSHVFIVNKVPYKGTLPPLSPHANHPRNSRSLRKNGARRHASHQRSNYNIVLGTLSGGTLADLPETLSSSEEESDSSEEEDDTPPAKKIKPAVAQPKKAESSSSGDSSDDEDEEEASKPDPKKKVMKKVAAKKESSSEESDSSDEEEPSDMRLFGMI